MKVLITGKGGQLGWELLQNVPADIECIGLDSKELDITNKHLIQQVVAQYQPDVVINTAAYTAVDKAETDQEQAYAVNETGAKELALICKSNNIRLLHVSTDFVFDGTKNTPYQTTDQTHPISVYGASKLAGDIAVMDTLPHAVIVRTAWVYSENGNNFVKTMLRLMAEKPSLNVVYDQVGTPTWAAGLAAWLWAIVQQPHVCGLYHWTDAGVASWYDFAIAIQELAIEKGMLKKSIPISPIPASQYPTPAKRPAFSVIDKSSAESVSGLQTVHWRKQLSSMLDTLKAHQ
ncbi:dTDP-4-dehydrorhamnose reductase [Paraglaciecola aquimarina]|uniref:dTDP-4-dehydrorhamnose reductase n=1 Tax=Paraglaciecola algarum TaxID=3050085 RepID=A0ABS9DCF4_9ALTE|nr:dTDP-4-dehydrorhamnose reductase [Paraglaciecola sp. G1-23]MCF2950027.1 dTDP-4-dehydrorhamnose reductase [Paraglaciecola sp. G1-23]